MKPYAVNDNHWKRLAKALLLSTHNICFHGEINRKKIKFSDVGHFSETTNKSDFVYIPVTFSTFNPFSHADQHIYLCNSVGPDETTSRLIRIYTVCHPIFDFRLNPLSVDMSKFTYGRVHFRNSVVKSDNRHSPCIMGKQFKIVE